MKTTIVIPAYNGLSFLKQNLPQILKVGADEIIIVDDASSDGTSDFIKSAYPAIKLIIHQKNTRFPIAVNDGFKLASGEVVILLNQDVTPKSDLLKFTLPHFNDSEVFAVTFNESGRSWAEANFTKGFIEFKNGKLDSQSHLSFWPSGGSSAIRKSMWDKLNGFDPRFNPGYFEDFDLGWRANRHGWNTIWDPNAKVDHLHPESTFNTSFTQKSLVRIKERNYLLSHWKNLSIGKWPEHLVFLFLRIIKSPGYLIPTLMAVTKIWQKSV